MPTVGQKRRKAAIDALREPIERQAITLNFSCGTGNAFQEVLFGSLLGRFYVITNSKSSQSPLPRGAASVSRMTSLVKLAVNPIVAPTKNMRVWGQ